MFCIADSGGSWGELSPHHCLFQAYYPSHYWQVFLYPTRNLQSWHSVVDTEAPRETDVFFDMLKFFILRLSPPPLGIIAKFMKKRSFVMVIFWCHCTMLWHLRHASAWKINTLPCQKKMPVHKVCHSFLIFFYPPVTLSQSLLTVFHGGSKETVTLFWVTTHTRTTYSYYYIIFITTYRRQAGDVCIECAQINISTLAKMFLFISFEKPGQLWYFRHVVKTPGQSTMEAMWPQLLPAICLKEPFHLKKVPPQMGVGINQPNLVHR
jgi:hypothetical protein